MGGVMMGGALGGSIADIARGALDPSRIPTERPPKDAAGNLGAMRARGGGSGSISSGTAADAGKCPKCGSDLPENAKFCLECGEKIETAKEGIQCPNCGEITPPGKFCLHCGSPIAKKCPNCGIDVPANGKFCPECGEKL